jgi:hypothetical protein
MVLYARLCGWPAASGKSQLLARVPRTCTADLADRGKKFEGPAHLCLLQQLAAQVIHHT